MTTISYAGYDIDTSALPEASTVALLRRGLVHFLGNEIASKIAAWKAKQEGEISPADVSAKRDELLRKAMEALAAGTVGQRVSSGPRASVDPVEAAMSRLAKAEITRILSAQKAKWVGKAAERKVTFSNGQVFSMAELVERRLANSDHAARIRKEAEKAVKAAAREAEKAKAAGEGLEAIG